jgi:cobalt/nickel transport system permease protein
MRLACAHDLAGTGIAGDPLSPVHRLDPRAKLLGLGGLTVVAATAPAHAWPAFAGCAALLVAVAAAARVRAGVVARRAGAIVPLVLLAAASIPFVHDGGGEIELGPLTASGEGLVILGAVAAKATVGTAAAVLLAATTTVPDALAGLQRLRVPAPLVAIAGVTWRYMFVLAAEVGRMRTALAARGHRPRHLLHGAVAGRLATALFLRAHARGERVHVAMAARGWRGVPATVAATALRRADLGFVAALAGVPIALRILLAVAP